MGNVYQDRFTLDDRYRQPSGVVFLSGVQALARLLVEQRRRDRVQGLDTAGFVSGYRGSPLGGLDRVLWEQAKLLADHQVHFQSGVNEELAATAVWGSQQVGLFPGATVEGVFGLWYGKAPGLDRAGDAIRHANAAGTSANGGVLLVVGDDHGCKSSTLPSHSELTLKDLRVPVLHPADVQDVLELGLLGWAMSRYSGCWTGMIALADTMDSAATVRLDALPDDFVRPPHDAAVHISAELAANEQEVLAQEVRLPLALRFARANGVNRLIADPQAARLGIVTTGKAYLDVREALGLLGLASEQDIAGAGIRLLKLGMSWPLDLEEMRSFSRGLGRVLVVEEKRAFVEESLKSLLHGAAAVEIVGKQNAAGEALLPSTGELDVGQVGRAIVRCLEDLGAAGTIHPGPLQRLETLSQARAGMDPERNADRLPMFCAGCPHNTSTRVPDGSRASAGIGCHYMAQWMDRSTATFTQMGGEGANWIGQAPFTDERHIFVNLGDGTYFHSGLLAIRQAVASGANVTYKILLNDAVAMTGGQRVDGTLSVDRLVRQVRAEGVSAVEVVSDDPASLSGVGAPVRHRDELDSVQRRFREVDGCSVIVYQQTCATELRRRRKRGLVEDPDVRVVINDAVCEGCGDCSLASNCVAVEPLVTGLGVKRQINQTSCNKDLSCIRGFCPAMVLVDGPLRKPGGSGMGLTELRQRVPEPPLDGGMSANLAIAGVGGTGVVTVSALLGTAAHIDGRTVTTLDMTGLAQKGGAVLGHVRIAAADGELHGQRIPAGQADVLLVCDLVTASSPAALALLDPERTLAFVNTDVAPTADFVLKQDADPRAGELTTRLEAFCREALAVDAADHTSRLLGGTATLNVFLLGFAFQRGVVPVSLRALERAIELNGVAVEANLKALHFGRLAASAPAALEMDASGAEAASGPMDAPVGDDLESVIGVRKVQLAAYQGEALARRYEDLVRRVQAAELALDAERDRRREGLSRAVAESYARLLAYKDEYEVARLFADGRFSARLKALFEPGGRTTYLMAPPAMGGRKRRFGAWLGALFPLLARLKFLRGTAFDPFGHSRERRAERWSITHYEAVIGDLLGVLEGGNHALAVRIAALPDAVRGFGHVKAAARKRWLDEEARLLAELHRSPTPVMVVDPGRRSAA